MDTRQFASGHVVVAGPQGADGQHDLLVPSPQLLDGQVDTDLALGDESGSLGPHLGQSLIEGRLLQLVLGDAVTQQPTEPSSRS